MIDRVFSHLRSKYIYVDPTALSSRYFSETECKIRQIFAFGRTIAPAVIVFDGLDGIVGKRTLNGGESDGGLRERIITTFLTELDGIDSSNSGVMVIGIANSIDKLDEAIIRRGRLGIHIFVYDLSNVNNKVGYPSIEDRRVIIEKWVDSYCSGEVINCKPLAEQTEGLTTGQVAMACLKTAFLSLRSCTIQLDKGIRELWEETFLEIVKSIRVSL